MAGVRLYLLLILASIASLVLGLSQGSMAIPFSDIALVWQTPLDPTAAAVIEQIRLPRVLSAFAIGGLLALAGALMQVLLRNPLADPYILGISGGAALAALLVMLLGLGGICLTLGAFGGALLATLIVFVLAHGRSDWSSSRLLLTGVVMAAGWGALISFILSIAPRENLPGMLFWLMGDLVNNEHVVWAWLVLAVGLFISLVLGRELNILSRGELLAESLGISVRRLQYGIYILASLLTATAVTLSGSVGFVGLIIPHLVRLVIGNDQRKLLPAAVLLGGILLANADTLSRVLLAPQQLPVGILTALIGVPLFLYLLRRGQTT
jgi:iron complex transport system permease protein